MLNSLPLATSILGVLFLFALVTIKTGLRKNGPAWITLIVIVSLAIHAQIDAYLFYNGWDGPWVGLSLLHGHLMGGLFLLFAYFLFQIQINIRGWTALLLGYTVLRLILFVPEDAGAYGNYGGDIDWIDLGIVVDYFLSNGLNIAALVIAWRKVGQVNFTVPLDKNETVYYQWLKYLLVFQITLYVTLSILTLISFFYADEWLFFWKIESMLSGFFFLVMAYFAIRFPLFAIDGDFRALSNGEKKYAKSSLTAERARSLWEEMNSLMQDKRLFRDPEYRLSDLAGEMDQSVHHVSQAINQEQGGSFSDFLNRYRVQEAESLLKSSRAEQVTILAIAYESGFNSKTTFYNAFKKLTGSTPTQYLRAHRS
ncbi:MAG: AraC family transcriptional regulator [Bacteroidota bacterium]